MKYFVIIKSDTECIYASYGGPPPFLIPYTQCLISMVQVILMVIVATKVQMVLSNGSRLVILVVLIALVVLVVLIVLVVMMVQVILMILKWFQRF